MVLATRRPTNVRQVLISSPATPSYPRLPITLIGAADRPNILSTRLRQCPFRLSLWYSAVKARGAKPGKFRGDEVILRTSLIGKLLAIALLVAKPRTVVRSRSRWTEGTSILLLILAGAFL